MKRLQRKGPPVRVSYVGVATLAYMATPWLIRATAMEQHTDTIYSALMALIALVTAAVGGDTYRPSGHAPAAAPMSAPAAAENDPGTPAP